LRNARQVAPRALASSPPSRSAPPQKPLNWWPINTPCTTSRLIRCWSWRPLGLCEPRSVRVSRAACASLACPFTGKLTANDLEKAKGFIQGTARHSASLPLPAHQQQRSWQSPSGWAASSGAARLSLPAI